jgi:hypothetical protein
MYNHENPSSAGSTPQATYAETDSDASSFYHPLDLEFPQPPASPALRRMQSSPLFTPEETNAVREFLRRRWGTHVKAQHAPTAEQSPLSDYSWDAESPECTTDPATHDLELAGEQLLQAATRKDSWLQMTRENVPSVAPLCPRRVVRPPPARVLRRAASMADPLTPQLLDAPLPPPLPSRNVLRFQDTLPPTTSLASAGRQKPHHRANLSVPLMGLGLPDAAVAPALGPSFTAHHRPARSQPTNVPRGGADPRSFIDLTPEKLVQRESTARVHRERIKRLLSRASSGFMGWGKVLAGKKGHS